MSEFFNSVYYVKGAEAGAVDYHSGAKYSPRSVDDDSFAQGYSDGWDTAANALSGYTH
ncbi:MAG TPA: hypothetical protein VIM84_01955 [Gemmatimonadales bacterium]